MRLFIWLMFPLALACAEKSESPIADATEIQPVDAIEAQPEQVTVADVTEVCIEGCSDIPDVVGDAGQTEWPPRSLPFTFTRPDEGQPLTAEEIREFTRRVTGFWKKVNFFRWLLRVSRGVDPSTGKPDFLNWWSDVVAIKKGDLVTFKQVGVDHNMWIPSAKILAHAIGGYLLTGDWVMGKLVEQYCKGLTATMKGMVYDEHDPNPYLMSRNTMTFDHEFVLDAETWHDDGRRKRVEYSEQFYPYVEWNAQRFEYKNNPYWGAVWVTNMRSKDDVCHIVRTTAFLPYVIADAHHDFVREACSETYQYMQGFNKDIVDSGYYIRTKDPEGKAYIIPDQDLGSYVWYVSIDPRNECPARLASDLIAYGRRLTNDCGTGTGSVYDAFAVVTHYYNYAIIWNFHMAALGNALVFGQLEDAFPLLEGLAQRADSYMHPSPDEPGVKNENWWADVAEFLVQASSFGLPLTSLEVRLIHKHWLIAIEQYEQFERWDLWDPSVPDGEYPAGGGFRPKRAKDGVRLESIALFAEYCFSPFKNPAGVAPVDCDVVKDPSRWGE